MGNFNIYQDNYADFTVVSNRFIDEYMEDANDAQLKIYLYLTEFFAGMSVMAVVCSAHICQQGYRTLPIVLTIPRRTS